MKKGKIKKILVGLALSMAVSSPINALAAPTYGADGQNPYADNGCAYGNRAGVNYISNLYNELNFYSAVGASTLYQNEHAWASDITGGFADSKNIFVFSGHGHPYDRMASYGNYTGSAAHFYTENSTTQNHPWTGEDANGTQIEYGHFTSASNAAWDNIRLGANQNRWALFYSCRFLVNGGNSDNVKRILYMFNGTHMIMGFASRMFLDAGEGDQLGIYLTHDNTWMNSYFAAAEKYQPQLDPLCNPNSDPSLNGKTIARIYGHKDYLYTDKINSPTTKAPVYGTANAGDFWTESDNITDLATSYKGNCSGF